MSWLRLRQKTSGREAVVGEQALVVQGLVDGGGVQQQLARDLGGDVGLDPEVAGQGQPDGGLPAVVEHARDIDGPTSISFL